MNETAIAIGAIVLLALFLHSGHVFTRKLPSEPGDEAAAHIVAIVRYGYIWIFILIFVGVVPFLFIDGRNFAIHQGAPIQVVKGCRAVDLEESADEPVKGCTKDSAQWWLSIGGVSERPRTALELAQESLNQVIAWIDKRLLDKPPDLTDKRKKQLKDSQNVLQNVLRSLKPHETKDKKNQDDPKVIQLTDRFVISGGLTVPLYMVILALLGGLISMTRRIPEIQKCGSMAYKQTYDKCARERQAGQASACPDKEPMQYPLEPEQVREHVIFQMMQAVTAPLIAATAYALIDMQSTASIVAVGFVSGFASEPILLQIRKAAVATASLFTQTATGKPDAASGAGGGAPVKRDTTKHGISKTPKDPDEAAQIALNAVDTSQDKA